jgi:hypothetical protein
MKELTAEEKVDLKVRAVAALRERVGRAESGEELIALAREIGKKPDAIGRYLTGHSMPPPTVARKILRVCKR